MTLSTSTLRPGILVAVKTSVTGNVFYSKRVIDGEHEESSGAPVGRWETDRRISHPKEHDAATKVRSAARAIIAGVCASSAFGFLCPETDAEKLEAAIKEARALVETFNDGARLTRIHL